MNIGIFATTMARGQWKLNQIRDTIPVAAIKSMRPGIMEIVDGCTYRVFVDIDKARGLEFTKIYLQEGAPYSMYKFSVSRLKGDETRLEYFE
jgi:hypothetical protein